MSSTELLDAASISMTSSDVASAIERHDVALAARRHGRAARPSRRRPRPGSSATPRGSWPSRSCRSRASPRTGRRGGRGRARSRCAGCARRAPGPPRRRTCAGGGDGTARGRRSRGGVSLVAASAGSGRIVHRPWRARVDTRPPVGTAAAESGAASGPHGRVERAPSRRGQRSERPSRGCSSAPASPTTTRRTRSSGGATSPAVSSPNYDVPVSPTPHPLSNLARRDALRRSATAPRPRSS